MSTPRPQRRPLSIPLGRPFGVPIAVSPSFVLLGVVVADLDQNTVAFALPQLRSGAVIGVSAAVAGALLLSVVLHELAHAAVGRGLRLPVGSVQLYLLGGLTNLGAEPRTAGDQALVSLAGPLVNVALAGVGAAVGLATAPHTVPWLLGQQVALVNVFLAAYNLVPGLPLDGGQLLRALLWRVTGDRLTALRGAAMAGLAVAGATAVYGVYQFSRGGTVGVFSIVVAFTVGASALQVLRGAGVARRFTNVDAGSLARPAFTAPADLPLSEALRRAGEVRAPCVLVGEVGNPTEVVVDALVSQVPESRRPWVPVSAAARRLLPGMVLDHQLSGEALLEALRATPASEYLVVDGPRVIGVLRVADVAEVAGARPPAAVVP